MVKVIVKKKSAKAKPVSVPKKGRKAKKVIKYESENSDSDNQNTRAEVEEEVESGSESSNSDSEFQKVEIKKVSKKMAKAMVEPKKKKVVRKQSTWMLALKQWNAGQSAWRMPRRGTPEHAEVKALQEQLLQKKGKK